MSRAKGELVSAVLVTVTLAVFLAWYQTRTPNAPEPVAETNSGAVARAEPEQPLVPALNAEPGVSLTDASEAEAVPLTRPPELPNAVLARDREFINEVFPTLSTWSLRDVKPLLSNAALQGSTDAELSQVMETLRDRLGELRYFDDPQPLAVTEELADATANAALQPYTFTAYYEQGEAEVNLVLEKRPQDSSLYSFDIVVPN